jgi:type IV secretory pathway component VirB8
MIDPRNVVRLNRNMTKAQNDSALRDFQPYHKPNRARRWVWSAVIVATVAMWTVAALMVWWLL